MYIAGNESLFQMQSDDKIVKELMVIHSGLLKLNSGDGDSNEFKKIAKEYHSILKARFNLNFELEDSEYFATFPLVNEEQFEGFTKMDNNVKQAHITNSKLKRHMENNRVTLDREKIKVYGLPEEHNIISMVNIDMCKNLTAKEFAAIELHEIAHTLTLLEMYNKTSDIATGLSDSLLKQNGLSSLLKELKISEGGSDRASIKLIMSKVDEIGDMIPLAGGGNKDMANVEFEADAVVVSFGLAPELASALNKLTMANVLGASTLPFLIVAINAMLLLITMLPMLIIGGLSYIAIQVVVITAIQILLRVTIVLATNINSRNPNGDIHGGFTVRLEKLRFELIGNIRDNPNLNKKQQKSILAQLDGLDREIKVLKDSIFDKILTSALTTIVDMGLNLEDELDSILESMVNNELYISELKLTMGVESNGLPILTRGFESLDSGIIYMTAMNQAYRGKLEEVVKGNKSLIKKLNLFLDNYNYELKYMDKKAMLASDKLVSIKSGISTIAIVPAMEGSKRDNKHNVIQITLDPLKLKMSLLNPHVEVYNIERFKVDEFNYVYIMETNYLYYDFTDKQEKIIDTVTDTLGEIYDDYGELPVNEALTKAIEILGKDELTKDVISQLELASKIASDNSVPSFLDLHHGNFAKTKEGKLIIYDPIYAVNNMARKVSNYVDISEYELDKK